jgi:erlin
MLLPLLMPALIACLTFFKFSLHSVPEGHVAVYSRGGALLRDIAEPGYHTKYPFVTHHDNVQTTVQTDSVNSIPCGTSGGVMISFDKVEVVNRLKKDYVYETIRNYTVNYDQTWIFDKIHHEINQFCSSHTLQEVYITLFDQLDEHLQIALQKGCDQWAPGIEIIAVRVTKPRIPDAIRLNFEQIEAEKAKLQVAMETQKVLKMNAETRKVEAGIKAMQDLEVAEIEFRKQVKEVEAQQTMQRIQNEAHLEHQKALADAEAYRKSKEAESNAVLFTPEFLKYEEIKGVNSVSKVYFGEKIPTYLADTAKLAP